MRSEKSSRGLYEALQRSRKGLKRTGGEGQSAQSAPQPQQQAFPFKMPQAGEEPQELSPEKQTAPVAAPQPAQAADAGSMPLLDAERGQQDDSNLHGRDERPTEHEPTPPSTVRPATPGQSPVESRRPVIGGGGTSPGGVSFGGGRTAPRTDLAGFGAWKPLIVILLAVVLGFLVLTLLGFGLMSIIRGDEGNGQSGGDVPAQGAGQSPDSALGNTGSNALQRELLTYNEALAPGEPIGEPQEQIIRQQLLPGVSGPWRIVIVSSTRPNLEKVQAYMLRQGVATKIVGGTLVTEQTFPDRTGQVAEDYLRRVQSLDDGYSRETGGRTSFDSAYFSRQ